MPSAKRVSSEERPCDEATKKARGIIGLLTAEELSWLQTGFPVIPKKRQAAVKGIARLALSLAPAARAQRAAPTADTATPNPADAPQPSPAADDKLAP